MQEVIVLDVLKVFGLSSLSFFVAFFSTPILTHYLYKYKMWSNRTSRESLGGGAAIIVGGILKERTVENTPRMGGILVWGTTLLVTLFFWILSEVHGGELFQKLNFFSRNQTWLPLAALLAGSFVGLIDDWMKVRGIGETWGGLDLTKRILLVLAIGAIGAWWFYVPLETNSILVPFYGEVVLGFLFIPFFMLTMLAVFSGGVIDGLDGLAG